MTAPQEHNTHVHAALRRQWGRPSMASSTPHCGQARTRAAVVTGAGRSDGAEPRPRTAR